MIQSKLELAEEFSILENLTSSNYGPDRTLEIRWKWTSRVLIRPSQRVTYRFSFSAWFENVAIVYSMPTLDLLAERGNYSRTSEDFEFLNSQSSEVEHIITGWHKPTPPRAESPWLHSPKYDFIGTPQVEIVGFADDQNRENQNPRDPNLYRNALVSIVFS